MTSEPIAVETTPAAPSHTITKRRLDPGEHFSVQSRRRMAKLALSLGLCGVAFLAAIFISAAATGENDLSPLWDMAAKIVLLTFTIVGGGFAIYWLVRYCRQELRIADGDLKLGYIEEITVESSDILAIKTESLRAADLLVAIGDGKLLHLTGPWLLDPKIYGGSDGHLRVPESTSVNRLKAPLAFPTTRFTLTRFPASRMVKSVTLDGVPIATGDPARIKYKFQKCQQASVVTGSLDAPEAALQQAVEQAANRSSQPHDTLPPVIPVTRLAPSHELTSRPLSDKELEGLAAFAKQPGLIVRWLPVAFYLAPIFAAVGAFALLIALRPPDYVTKISVALALPTGYIFWRICHAISKVLDNWALRRRLAKRDLDEGRAQVVRVRSTTVSPLIFGKSWQAAMLWDIGGGKLLITPPLRGPVRADEPNGADDATSPDERTDDETQAGAVPGETNKTAAEEPLEFPNSEFELHRLPHSGALLKFEVQGEHFDADTPIEVGSRRLLPLVHTDLFEGRIEEAAQLLRARARRSRRKALS